MFTTPRQRIRAHLRVYAALPPHDECRRLRESARVSQAVVARAVGVSASAVGAWERGERRPSPAVAGRYAEVLSELRRAVSAV